MDRKQIPYEEFREVLAARLRHVRDLAAEEQEPLARRAWEMVQRDVPWEVVLAATRAAAPLRTAEENQSEGPIGGFAQSELQNDADSSFTSWNEDEGSYSAGFRDANDLNPPPERRNLSNSPPPLRHEVGRYERERLSASTRQAIRMARHARRWHEIRKMRNILMNIDQGYLKRMLGAESDSLSQEINALLRSWAPLVRDRQQSRSGNRRRR